MSMCNSEAMSLADQDRSFDKGHHRAFLIWSSAAEDSALAPNSWPAAACQHTSTDSSHFQPPPFHSRIRVSRPVDTMESKVTASDIGIF